MSDPSMVGRTVSHYQILEKLGAGGMGEIYKALDPRLNRFVAIKVLPAAMSSDPSRRRRFIQEAQAASALNHPNIITIHDVVSEPDAELMVMEFVAGKTLLDLIPKGGLRVPQVLNYCVQIADALSAAHAAGIIHRDLKPGNVMVTDAGLVKVLDFGLAKLQSDPVSQAGDEAETVANESLTMAGSILGTVSYMSPEQAQGRPVDARSDIFSFGVLLYEMSTGARPFGGESPISTLSAILRDEARPVAEIAPDVPPGLDHVIALCLRKEPGDRWQAMREVHAALAALKHESESGALYRKDLPAPPRRRSRAAAPLVLAAILVAGAAGVWWFARPARAPQAFPAVSSHPPEPLPAQPSSVPSVPQPSVPQPPAPQPPPAPVTLAVKIRDGSPLSITLADDIPADVPTGATIRFTVNNDFVASGAVVIRKGALVEGEIAQQAKKKFLGLGGKTMLRLLTVEAADGQSLRLRATPANHGDSEMARLVESGGRKRVKGIASPAGTPYVAYIDGVQSVSVRK